MRLFIILLMILCMLIFPLSACTLEVKTPPASSAPSSSASSAPEASAEPTAASSPELTPTAEPTPEPPTPEPEPTVSIYSSYADMVSFDPSIGEAEFDYWNMLKGDEAVEYLVDHEGYTLANAQAEVADYADSEFIKSNNNPQLRTIDLSAVPVRMMFHTDGTQLAGAEPIATSFADLCSLYTAHPDLVLHSFFYYVTVSSGGSISVDQVFWP